MHYKQPYTLYVGILLRSKQGEFNLENYCILLTDWALPGFASPFDTVAPHVPFLLVSVARDLHAVSVHFLHKRVLYI